MKLTSFRISNYRSIYGDYKIDTGGLVTIVGGNNSGKTNLLKALKTFFCAKNNPDAYDKLRDIPYLSDVAQTSMAASFIFEEMDIELVELYKEIFSKLDHKSSRGGQTHPFSFDANGKAILPSDITLYLTFSKDTGNPSYTFFKGVKRAVVSNQFTNLERKMVDLLLSKFECIYVPSSKSVEELIDSLVIPFLKKKASDVIKPHLEQLLVELSGAASEINKKLSSNGMNDMVVEFGIPDDNVEKLLTKFDFKINDNYQTSINDKGMGIQCLSLFSSFEWISKEKLFEGIRCIWLIEEPESFLNPGLYTNCNTILSDLSEKSNVIITTHALSFISNDPDLIVGTSKEMDTKVTGKGKRATKEKRAKTVIGKFKRHQDATKDIRNSLGIKFSDYFAFNSYNVLVEGMYDAKYINWYLGQSDKSKWPLLRSAKIIDFGGCGFLAGFLNSNYQFIYNEVAFVSIFDGDEAGIKSRRSVSNRLGNVQGVKFVSGESWISIPNGFAIEGILHDTWIEDAHNQSSSWIPDFGKDISGKIQPFSVNDDRKKQFFEFATAHAKTPDSWDEKWIMLMDSIEIALEKNAQRLDLI
ncbi:Predicted ATPase [Serratia liquefaciens]|uniref:ATP-dependent nuclease n=1 Tax=Serratia liquefaciens TaxID=614 RepID=UPI00217ABE93|nr:AAA family ATPase [Serratia liquefaciens]CAI1132734.1 Predicted ATPase [Serratia liquefaciens]CAI1511305.1 Predicted ATPase [Serratia liquefaciens]